MKVGEFMPDYSNKSFSSIGMTYTEYDEEDNSFLQVIKEDLTGIFGIPYQFSKSVDPRIPGTEVGRKYAEKIVSKAPLLFLTPCKQVFMSDFTNEERSNILTKLLDGASDIDIFSGLENSGKYYTTRFDYSEYAKYVNTLCAALSFFLEINDVELSVPGQDSGGAKKISDINWNAVKNQGFDDYFAASNAAVFYVDGMTTMDESFSNSTTESALASKINGYSDMANEIKFLLGEDSALTALVDTAESLGDSIGEGLSGLVDNLAGGMLSDLSQKGVSTVIAGGKIIFPKIWNNSDFNRSYSFSIKLRSPDHDTLSIFINVLVPYIHLLALVLPKTDIDNEEYVANSFMSPFLVKAYSKGMFNIDMGIITDMSVTRGAECQWNDDGLPTQIDVNITIEDLYSNLAMSHDDRHFSAKSIVKNTAMMDFLANLAGLNIADQEIARQVQMYFKLTGAKIGQTDSRIYNKFDTGIANLISKIYK